MRQKGFTYLLLAVALFASAYFLYNRNSPPILPKNSTICTEIGCGNGTSIMIESQKAWQPGNYVVEVTTMNGLVGNKKDTCAATLPLAYCGAPNFIHEEPVCSSDDITLSLSGCMLPESEQSISDVYISRTDFQKMDIKIYRDNQLLSEKSFNPEWITTQPNGPGCEPTCRQGTVDDRTISF